jgi:hypothetical protein
MSRVKVCIRLRLGYWALFFCVYGGRSVLSAGHGRGVHRQWRSNRVITKHTVRRTQSLAVKLYGHLCWLGGPGF